jgi:hypothetical protein
MSGLFTNGKQDGHQARYCRIFSLELLKQILLQLTHFWFVKVIWLRTKMFQSTNDGNKEFPDKRLTVIQMSNTHHFTNAVELA